MEKAPDAFRTISEVADEIDVPQHVLRFWESRFPQIRPMKRGGGRRYYRPDDVDLLRGVRHLLYGEGYTIRGVQRILREQGVAFVQTIWSAEEKTCRRRTSMMTRPGRRLPSRRARRGPSPICSRSHRPARHRPLPRSPSRSAASRRSCRPYLLSNRLPRCSRHPRRPQSSRRLSSSPQEDRQKLQAALDQLVACRQIIETALHSG